MITFTITQFITICVIVALVNMIGGYRSGKHAGKAKALEAIDKLVAKSRKSNSPTEAYFRQGAIAAFHEVQK